MPKDIYYEDIKVVKKSYKSKLKSFFLFFCIVVVFALTIFTSTYLSRALTVGKLGNIIFFGNSVSSKKHSYFSVILGAYETYEEAEKVGQGATLQGASGYVWEESEFLVIGNIYPDKSSAEKVMENLKASNYNTEIREIVFDGININCENYENSQIKDIRNGIEFIDKVYESLYTYSNKFDYKELSNLAVSSYISDLRGECKTYISKMQDILVVSNDSLKEIQLSLIKIDELLNQTMLKTIENVGVGHTLKNAVASVVAIKYSLHKSL